MLSGPCWLTTTAALRREARFHVGGVLRKPWTASAWASARRVFRRRPAGRQQGPHHEGVKSKSKKKKTKKNRRIQTRLSGYKDDGSAHRGQTKGGRENAGALCTGEYGGKAVPIWNKLRPRTGQNCDVKYKEGLPALTSTISRGLSGALCREECARLSGLFASLFGNN